MNVKAIALGSIVAISSIFGGTMSAKAQTCLNFAGGVLCNSYEYSNRYGQVYTVGFANDRRGWGERMTVVCDGRNLVTWKSHGNLTQRQAAILATEFCALPN